MFVTPLCHSPNLSDPFSTLASTGDQQLLPLHSEPRHRLLHRQDGSFSLLFLLPFPPSPSPKFFWGSCQYLVNHFLDVNISIAGEVFPAPATAELNTTNALGPGTGTLLAESNSCVSLYGFAPTFTLVDFYDMGQGSVFGSSPTPPRFFSLLAANAR